VVFIEVCRMEQIQFKPTGSWYRQSIQANPLCISSYIALSNPSASIVQMLKLLLQDVIGLLRYYLLLSFQFVKREFAVTAFL
jgi:hypothetical protein